MMNDTASHLELSYEESTGRRVIAGKDVIIHCHHYNSRIQRTIESAAAIDGKGLFVSSAESVFAEQIATATRGCGSRGERWELAQRLYAQLGLGRLDFTRIEDGLVRATSSHFVEGWNAGFPGREAHVCSLTEGYLQGAVHAIAGEVVRVREVECMIRGSGSCRFEVDRDRDTPFTPNPIRGTPARSSHPSTRCRVESGVDEQKIIDALVAMPIHGDAQGLIPNFNVYLANLPADFYNLACLRFIEAMSRAQLGDTAKMLLKHDAETCGMNTFRGIMLSPEWEALVAPMVASPEDALHGIIAVSNALGWGSWRVQDLKPREYLELATSNGYEADGVMCQYGEAAEPSCLMLAGVAAGIMELIYGEGSLEDRFGQFESVEPACRACGAAHCRFEVGSVQ